MTLSTAQTFTALTEEITANGGQIKSVRRYDAETFHVEYSPDSAFRSGCHIGLFFDHHGNRVPHPRFA